MKNKEHKTTKVKKQYDKGQVFVKIMAGILVILMMAGTGISLVYSIMS